MSAAQPAPAAEELVTFDSARGKWVLLATVLGSALAGIDATVVNIALPAIGADLQAGFGTLQWTVTAYALTLASLILLGGVLGDRYGRRRVFLVGVVWFAAASLLCGAAPDGGALVAARALQGVGGALLTPASLAILQVTFTADDRGRAIGAWSGLGGVATAIGPFLGGWLVDVATWRWVFLVNVPVAVAVVLVTLRHVPETRERAVGSGAGGSSSAGGLDWMGSSAAIVALAGLSYALIRSDDGMSPAVLSAAAIGCAAAAAFAVVERRSPHPVLPPSIFASAQFRAVNAVTFVVYGALGVVFFLLVVQLQVVSGFGPVAAGTAMLPITVVMLALSARSGQLASRIGPRLQMTAGPLLCAAGLLLLLRVGPGATYVGDVLPGVLVFGLGLAALVAPLTAAALAVVPTEHAGLGSGVNNAVARTGGLLAVAAVPALVGLSGRDYQDPAAFDAGFTRALWFCVAAMLLGAALAFLRVRGTVLETGPAPDREPAAASGPTATARRPDPDDQHLTHCGVGAPPPVTRSTQATAG